MPIISVEVHGPLLLAEAIKALLSRLPEVRVRGVAPVVVLVGEDWHTTLDLLRQDRHTDGLERVVLVTCEAEPNLLRACELGLQVFVSHRDPVEELHHALNAAERMQEFCSPALMPILMRELRQRTPLQPVNGLKRKWLTLTPQERSIAIQAAAGLSNEEIGRSIHLSVATVKYHLTRIFSKLEIHRRTQLAGYLARLDISEPDGAAGSPGKLPAEGRAAPAAG